MRAKLNKFSFIFMFALLFSEQTIAHSLCENDFSSEDDSSINIKYCLSMTSIGTMQEPEYQKSFIDSKGRSYLFVSRDTGSGLETRVSYVYRFGSGSWFLIGFTSISSAHPTLIIEGKSLRIVDEKGDALAIFNDPR